MKKFWYFVSSVLLAVPFLIGWVLGYFYRGLKAGFYTGFASLQKSLEQDLMEKVQYTVALKQLEALQQVTNEFHNIPDGDN